MFLLDKFIGNGLFIIYHSEQLGSITLHSIYENEVSISIWISESETQHLR